MAKRRFSNRLIGNEITMHGYIILTSTECTTIMIVELAVTRSLGSSLEQRVWFGCGMGLVMVLVLV
jgi:hypothetical protein